MNNDQIEKLVKLLWEKLFGETDIDEGSVIYNMVIRPILTVNKMLADAAASLYNPENINDTQFRKHTAVLNGIPYSETGYSAEVILYTDVDMLYVNAGDQFVTENGLILTASYPQTLSGPKTVIDGKPGYIIRCESPSLPELPVKITGWPDSLPISGGTVIQQLTGGNANIDLNLSVNDALLSREAVKALLPYVNEIGLLEAGSEFASDIRPDIITGDSIYQGFQHKVHNDNSFNENSAYVIISIDNVPAPDEAFDPSYEISTEDYYYLAFSDGYTFVVDPTLTELSYGSSDRNGIPDDWIGGLHGLPPGSLVTSHEIRVYNGKLVLGYRELDNNDWADWQGMRERIEDALLDPGRVANLKKELAEIVRQYTSIDDAKLDPMLRQVKSEILSKIRTALSKAAMK